MTKETVSSGDFKVAYLQSDEHPIGAEEIAVLRDPEKMGIRSFVGAGGWLAQTPDPNLAPYVTILGKYNSKPVKT